MVMGIFLWQMSTIIAYRSSHASGQFLSAVGKRGNGPLQFNKPMEIAFNTVNKKVYVVEYSNNRVQILNSDLTFSSKFDNKGSGKGRFDSPLGIACDSTGNVYVADTYNQSYPSLHN